MEQTKTTDGKKGTLPERRSILFYSSFYEVIKTLSKPKRAFFYDKIMEYAFEGVVPELPLDLERHFIPIQAQLDANEYKWQKKVKQGEHGIKGATHGIKGGRPRKKRDENEENNNSNIDDFVLTEEMQKELDEHFKYLQETP